MAFQPLTHPIRWGIIGCGDVTERKSGPAFSAIAESELVAVMRRDGARAEDYARRHGVPRWTTDADEIIHHPEIDAVYIATPPGSHCDYALRVASAGKPAYVEKPMARNAAECRRMTDAFEEAEQPLFVAYYRRGLQRFHEVRSLLKAEEIGQLTSVLYHYAGADHRLPDPAKLPWRLEAAESGGGRYLDLAAHALDILDFILGPLEEVEGDAWNQAAPYAVEDTVHGRFRTQTGAPGVATWNFASGASRDRFEFEGTEGRISLTCFGDDPVVLTKGKEAIEIARPNPATIQQPLIQTIVDQLRGRGECPSTGDTALRTSEVMDAMLRDYYGGRSDAFWERPDSWPGRRV